MLVYTLATALHGIGISSSQMTRGVIIFNLVLVLNCQLNTSRLTKGLVTFFTSPLNQLMLNNLNNINMGTIKAKIDYSQNGANDEYYTPAEAVEMIIPFIPKSVKTIWECTAIKESLIVEVLQSYGYDVIPSHIKDGKDFLTYEPEEPYDLIITNPPYSIKDKFLRRAFDLKKPFMFLLPITTLEGLKRGKMFRENSIQLLIPDIRFSFTAKKNGAWFQTSWFTHGLGLHKDLNFVPINGVDHSPVQRLNTGTPIIDLNNEFRQAA